MDHTHLLGTLMSDSSFPVDPVQTAIDNMEAKPSPYFCFLGQRVVDDGSGKALRWEDQFSTARHTLDQGTDTKRPTIITSGDFGNQQVLQFDGGDDFVLPSMPNFSQFTLFVITDDQKAVGNSTPISFGQSGDYWAAVAIRTTPRTWRTVAYNGGVKSVARGIMDTAIPRATAMTYNSGLTHQILKSDNSLDGEDTTTSPYTVNAAAGGRIGSWIGGDNFQGVIAGIVGYNTILSSADRADVLNELNNLFGGSLS